MKKSKSLIVFASAILMAASTGVAYADTKSAETHTSAIQVSSHSAEANKTIPVVVTPDGKELLDENLDGDWGKELKRQGVDIDNPEFRKTYLQEVRKINSVAEHVPINQLSNYSSRAKRDHCTLSPDTWGKAKFYIACDHHDDCYSKGSHTDRYVCDKHFHERLRWLCRQAYPKNIKLLSDCYGAAAVYYGAVRTFGSFHYEGKGKNN